MAEKISVTDIPSYNETREDQPMSWDFEFPPNVDAERIFVSMGVIRAIHRVAAFRSTHIASYQGGVSQFTPNIRDVDGWGRATASASGVTSREPVSEIDVVDDYDNTEVMQHTGKRRVRYRLNRAEIASGVADRAGKAPREQIWAEELDKALSGSIRTAAKRHLLTRAGRDSRLFQAAIGTFLGLQEVVMIATGNETAAATALTVTYGTGNFLAALQSRQFYDNMLLQERRWTLNPMTISQPDRYLAVSALTRTMPLISAKK